MQLLYSKDARVTKYWPIARTSLQDNSNSLPIVGDRYSTTRTQNAFASLIMAIEAFDPPSYWYNLSSNNNGSLCKLLLLEGCMFLSMLIKCGLFRRKIVCGTITKIIRNDQWTSFKSEYDLVNIEIIKSNVDVLVENSCAGGMCHLSGLEIKIILHPSKYPNNTSLIILLQ